MANKRGKRFKTGEFIILIKIIMLKIIIYFSIIISISMNITYNYKGE